MYLLFRYHHILPSTYFKMGIGEKTVSNETVKRSVKQYGVNEWLVKS